MGLFDGYFDPEQFQASSGLLGRLLSLQQQQGQYQPGGDFDQAPTVPQAPALLSMPSPVLPNYGQMPSVPPPPAQDLKSQYAALLPILGDHNAMLATVNPEIGKALIAQALAGQQQSGDTSASGSTVNETNSALTDFYHQTILKAGKDIAGYVTDAINDPVAFSHSIGPSLAALGPIASGLPAAFKGAMRLTGILQSGAQQNLGDLTAEEVRQIQSVVNQAGRPLEVVGSAARANRNATSDIDYVVPPSSMRYYEGLQEKLPGVDPKHGIIPGTGNANMGPVVRFEPK
jgi:hypothetical protein